LVSLTVRPSLAEVVVLHLKRIGPHLRPLCGDHDRGFIRMPIGGLQRGFRHPSRVSAPAVGMRVFRLFDGFDKRPPILAPFDLHVLGKQQLRFLLRVMDA